MAALSSMNVAVHGEGEIAVPCDGLQRLGIHARFVQQGQVAVAEGVGRGVVQIDCLAHVVEHRAVGGHQSGFSSHQLLRHLTSRIGAEWRVAEFTYFCNFKRISLKNGLAPVKIRGKAV